MAEKKKRKLPVFYKVLFTCIIIALIAIAVGMLIIYGALDKYEKSQPKNVADSVFAEYYANHDFKKLAEKCAQTNSFESADAIAAYLNENYSNANLTCTSGASQNGELTYIVKADDVKFSYFTLKEINEDGFSYYEPSIFTAFGNYGKVMVDVPDGYKLYINSVEVSDSLITSKGVADAADIYLPEGVTGPVHDIYTISSLMNEPVVTATANDGSEAEVIADTSGKNFTVTVVSDKALESEMSEYCLKVAEEYSKMMEADSSWGVVSQYIDPSSDLYANALESAVNSAFVWDHDSYRFEDEKVGSFYRYNDDVFSCRMTFTHILTLGTKEFRDYFDSTFIFRNVDGQYKVCGMINHS